MIVYRCLHCGHTSIGKPLVVNPYCTIACERAHIPRSEPQPEPYDQAQPDTDHMDDMLANDEEPPWHGPGSPTDVEPIQ